MPRQTKIEVKSGNLYFCQGTSTGIDVCSEEFDGSREYADRARYVTINRVQYFARGVYSISPTGHRWDRLGLHAYRPGGFENPTPAARPKIEAEIVEAATIFARRHPSTMAGGLARDLDSHADRRIRDAEKLESQAWELRAQAADLKAAADQACRRDQGAGGYYLPSFASNGCERGV